MLDLSSLGLAPNLTAASVPVGFYRGPERRRERSTGDAWLQAALDEIDYGVLVADGAGRVRHANRVARDELADEHPLQLAQGQLRARQPVDNRLLLAALSDAAGRGLRRLIGLGEGTRRASVSVVPLDSTPLAMVILGKRSVSPVLAVQSFARLHGLTAGEARVLERLVGGVRPVQIAAEHGVALSTVRTQIGSIRQKTGAASISALLDQMAKLPPLLGTLGRAGLRPQQAPC